MWSQNGSNYVPFVGAASIAGTANQVLVNGTSGSAQTGAITLTTPQAIGTGSNVAFNSLTVGSAAGSTANVIQSNASGGGISFQNVNGNFQVNGNGAISIANVLTTAGGVNVTTTATSSIQTSGGINIGNTGSANGAYRINNTIIITSAGIFEGAGALCGSNGFGGAGFNPFISGASTNPANYFSGIGTGVSPTTVTIANTASFQVAGGVIISVTAVSDARLKTVVGSYKHGLEALRFINPVLYEWNDLAQTNIMAQHPQMRMPTGVHIGFLAQEIQAVMPIAAYQNKDGYLGINKDGILAALVVAVKQLDGRLTGLGV